MVVCKFGGTSLADASQIKKVAAILASDTRRSAVVVSAPGKRTKTDMKITDLLYACEASAARSQPFDKQFAEIRERYLGIVRELGLDPAFIFGQLDEVESLIAAGSGPDYAASRGEYLSALIVAAFLGWTFIDAAEVVVLEEDGTIAEQTYANVAAATSPEGRYVFPGFYGKTRLGKEKTFSRGGSDITGSIVARGMHAELYENWTDVSGVFMADPRIIADAKVIDTMTYREVRELAAVGFNVFHEEAIAPVRDAGIPIRVKNTNHPEAPGTAIVSERDCTAMPLIGVTVKTGYCRLVIEKLMLLRHAGLRERLEATLRTLGVSAEFAAMGIDSVAWFFPSSQVANGLLASIGPLLQKEFGLDTALCETGFALAAVGGEGMNGTAALIAKAWPSLASASVDVLHVSFGVSRTTCLFAIPEGQAITAVKALYDALLR